MRLLIVDDEPIVLKALSHVLVREGHTVERARGGVVAIEAFQKALDAGEPFELVITDLDMTDTDGRVVAREIKTRSPNTPVFLFTGWGEGAVAIDAQVNHVDRILNKMAPIEELRAAIQSIATKD